MEAWGDSDTHVISTGNQLYYKHKKDRKDRVRFHYKEWESDLVKYIESTIDGNYFISCTQNKICKEIVIARSTLNELLKQSTKIVYRVKGIGRGAKTELLTVVALFKAAIKVIQTKK